MISYKIAQMFAKEKKTHLDAESIILPALTIAVDIMLRSEAAKEFRSHIKLCHVETVIRLKTFNITSKIIFHGTKKDLKNLALPIDESTDISSKAQLLAFSRILTDGKTTEEYFL